MSKVIVVGGGASGMMAAISAAQIGHEVILLEKNEKLGKKIYITGKGRCNVTNASDNQNIMKNIMNNSKFMYSALAALSSEDLMNMIEEEGCPLKVERGNRVFPVTDHASDITKALTKRMKTYGVVIRLNTAVSSLIIEEDVVKGVILKNNQKLLADAVIVATGGLSYPTTGSTGDGYKFARAAGVEVTDTNPGLVPFDTKEQWTRDLKGLSLRNVQVKIHDDKKVYYDGFGEMLFTHFGVSGPTLLSASSIVSKKLPLTLSVDLKPALDVQKLDERILRDFKDNNNKAIDKVIGKLVPARLGMTILELCHIPNNKVVHDITKEERQLLVSTIKDLKMTLNNLRSYNEAIITQGGVSIKEITPSTMESKKIKSLYFVGEVLDVDALTGGYNLQVAFSSGYLAGLSVEY